jgi:zinc transport system permease protein
MEWWHGLVESLLPFDWAQFDFMKNALLAVILITPAFGLLGTMVIQSRLTFFSDVLGHSALTGIAIGVVLGMGDPLWAMLIFAVILAVGINLIMRATSAAPDVVIGVFFAITVALGVVLLSRGGQFNKFTTYLIGDILAVNPEQILLLVIMLGVVLAYWMVAGNALVLVSISPVLASSRGLRVMLIRTSFAVLLALAVTISIRWVGILLINSLLVLPAVSGRLLAHSVRGYCGWSVLIALVSGVSGLIVSFYWGTSSGATIVLFAAVVYGLVVLVKQIAK